MVKPSKRSNRRSRRRRSGKDFPTPPSTSMLSYRGPIPTRTAENGAVVLLREIATLSTGAGTSFNSIIDNNPSGCDNWSEYSTSWSEYRVLGIRFEYVPQFAVNTAVVNVSPLVHCILHMKSNPAITSYPQAFSYGDSHLGHVCRRRLMEWRMSTPEEASFLDTNAPAGVAVAYTNYAEGLTTATQYGILFVTYLVQFRNARK